MMPSSPMVAYTYKHLLPPFASPSSLCSGLAFFFPALADGGPQSLLSSPLPAGAMLAGLFLALSGVEGE